MIDEFWRFYGQIRFAYHYHRIVRNRLIRLVKDVSVISYIITAISLAGWSITKNFAAVWSVIIFASQLSNGLKDLLDWNRKIWSLEAYLSEMNEIILNAEKIWRQILLGALTEEKIRQCININNEKYKSLECQYIIPCHIDESPSVIKSADDITNSELESLHGKGEQNESPSAAFRD